MFGNGCIPNVRRRRIRIAGCGYTTNRAAGNETAIEASPVGKTVIEFVAAIGTWAGTPTELLIELDGRAEAKTKGLKSWPATARTLGAAIKRLAPNLREAGIGIEFGRTGRSRSITLTRKVAENNVTNVTNVTAQEKYAETNDGAVTQNGYGNANDVFNVTTDEAANPEEEGDSDSDDVGDAKIPAYSNSLETIEI